MRANDGRATTRRTRTSSAREQRDAKQQTRTDSQQRRRRNVAADPLSVVALMLPTQFHEALSTSPSALLVQRRMACRQCRRCARADCRECVGDRGARVGSTRRRWSRRTHAMSRWPRVSEADAGDVLGTVAARCSRVESENSALVDANDGAGDTRRADATKQVPGSDDGTSPAWSRVERGGCTTRGRELSRVRGRELATSSSTAAVTEIAAASVE